MEKRIQLKRRGRDQKIRKPRRGTSPRDKSFRHRLRKSFSESAEKKRINKRAAERKGQPAIQIGISVHERIPYFKSFHTGDRDTEDLRHPFQRAFAHISRIIKRKGDQNETDRKSAKMQRRKHSARRIFSSRRKKFHFFFLLSPVFPRDTTFTGIFRKGSDYLYFKSAFLRSPACGFRLSAYGIALCNRAYTSQAWHESLFRGQEI